METFFTPKRIVTGTICGIALVMALAFWPLRTVPTGTRGVVTVGGAIRGIEQEGYLLIAPWQQLTIFSIRSETANIENSEGSTIDTQPVHVNLTVRYAIDPMRVSEVFEKYTHTGNLDNFIQTATQEVLKAVTARYTAPDLIAKRAQVSSDIVAALQNKVKLYGANVINLDMRNFSFSAEYMAAINDKVTQDQKRQAADNKLKTVESEQKQKVAVAEAEASAVKAKADGDAYSVLKNAQAQAESLRLLNTAVAQNKDVLELKRIEVQLAQAHQWDGKLPQNIYGSAPIPYMNLPSPAGK